MHRYPVTLIVLVLAASRLAVASGIPLEDDSEHAAASAPAFVPMQAIVKFRKDARNVIASELPNVSTCWWRG